MVGIDRNGIVIPNLIPASGRSPYMLKRMRICTVLDLTCQKSRSRSAFQGISQEDEFAAMNSAEREHG
jgi:hypothetical protein